MSDASAHWEQGGGDLFAAVDVLTKSRRPGALLSVEIERAASDDALVRGLKGELLRKAWDLTIAMLPVNVVARRTLWLRFESVLEGAKDALGELGVRLLTALRRDNHLGPFVWQIVLVEICGAEPERTFYCDPGYDLRAARGRSVVAWVQPYSGSDWRQSPRYPTVSFLSLDPESTSA